jgi:pyridoxal phosphate enzyme (YggS family)
MSDSPAKIADNLIRVRERMANAAVSASRRPEEVQLVAVTKYVGPAEAAALLTAGCPLLGESRPQQLWDKAAEPSLADARWHMIGHLQRNKVRRTLPLVELIHSVDSLRLVKAIDDGASELGKTSRVLLEVNCSGDVEKHGLTADGLKELLPQLATLSHVEVCGLMTMAAREGDVRVAAENFAALRQLRDAVRDECPPQVRLTELSMGMSHDFEIAIREGATIVRVGSLLFEGIVSR